MDKEQNTFDFYLRNALYVSGVSREELARHLGVPVPVVNRWLNGVAAPDVCQFREIAHYLGMCYEWFLDGKPDALNTEELAVRLGLPETTVKAMLLIADSEDAAVMDAVNDAIWAVFSAVIAVSKDLDEDISETVVP